MRTLYGAFVKVFMMVIMLCLPFFVWSQTESGFITIDQFGYRPQARKVAVIRTPQLGSDKNTLFTPGTKYQLIDAGSKEKVFEDAPRLFNSGSTDAASGDKIWWFDFSSVTAPGRYYVLDVNRNVKSYTFGIGEDVYNEVLKHAVRMFFYQRAGCEKEARYAGEGWADGASHVRPLQDKNCRLYNDKNNPATERDLHGGWYDAGDYNKYTAWAANYVEAMLLTYLDYPDAFSDDYNIPESGNGIPDLLDEVKWGMDWLLRMQNENGSLLSIVGMSHAFPPSAATGQSLYGPANTIATITGVKAFALGAKVFAETGMVDYAAKLKQAALKAWQWADANPNVFFHNNSSSNGSAGLGAGNQESEDKYTRLENRSLAGLYMYELTGESSYLAVFEQNYRSFPLFEWSSYTDQYRHKQHLLYLRYLHAPYGSASIKNEIRTFLLTAFNRSGDYGGMAGKDGYRSFVKDYNWGSNQYKSEYGLFFYLWAFHDMEPAKSDLYNEVSEDYIHYIHGTNPLGLVYLTNMNGCGASNSLTEIYHSWFDHFSSKWDKVGVSTYGPAPGYLAGGANEYYRWDGCCDGGTCGSAANNSVCTSEPIPVDEPPAKMYKDFNTSWPLNSWELTEPSNGYQIAYIRLLSKFVSANGSTGIGKTENAVSEQAIRAFPNPIKKGELLTINLAGDYTSIPVSMYKLNGEVAYKNTLSGNVVTIETAGLQPGAYLLKIDLPGETVNEKITIF